MSVAVSLGTRLAQAEGKFWNAHRLDTVTLLHMCFPCHRVVVCTWNALAQGCHKIELHLSLFYSFKLSLSLSFPPFFVSSLHASLCHSCVSLFPCLSLYFSDCVFRCRCMPTPRFVFSCSPCLSLMSRLWCVCHSGVLGITVEKEVGCQAQHVNLTRTRMPSSSPLRLLLRSGVGPCVVLSTSCVYVTTSDEQTLFPKHMRPATAHPPPASSC